MFKYINRKINIILALILFCYLYFLAADISNNCTGSNYSIAAKYLGLLLCFIITIIIGRNGHDLVDTRMLQSGLFLTACADYCLLISNKYILGVLIFCIVQIIYVFRYTRDLKSKAKIFSAILIIYVVLSITIFTTIKTGSFDLRLTLICLFYGCLITMSLITGIRTLKTNYFPLYSSIMISIGMILFFMCDVNVALFNILQSSGSYFAYISGFLMWMFYLPAQVLLALSGYKHNDK
jgi:hypothetical protein